MLRLATCVAAGIVVGGVQGFTYAGIYGNGRGLVGTQQQRGRAVHELRVTMRPPEQTKEEALREKLAEKNEDISEVCLWLVGVDEGHGYKRVCASIFESHELEQIGFVYVSNHMSDPL